MAFLNITVKSELTPGEFRQRVAGPIEAALASAGAGTLLDLSKEGESYKLMLSAPDTKRAGEIIQRVLRDSLPLDEME